MRLRGGAADIDGAPSPDSPQGRRRTSMRRWVAGALTLLAAGVLLWVFGGVTPDETRSSRLPRPSSSSSDATAQPSLPPLPTQQGQETAAPAALDVAAPVRFGSEGVGVLGKLGVRARLRTLLKSGSDLCDMCGPTNPGAAAAASSEPWKDADLERLPAFCKAQGAEDAEAVPHYEGNQLPLADDDVVLPERTAAIFVAIGTTLHGVDKKKKGEAGGGQDYLEHAVRQWRLFNPPTESVVYIVISDKYRDDAVVLRWATEFEAEIVWESEIQATPYWKEYERVFYVQGYMHPGGSRKDGNKDFNKLVMQRFHVVHALMLQKKLTHVVHLENDILLYARWRDLLKPIVRCGHQMSSTFASPKGVIPSVVYIRSAEAIRKLVEFVNSLLSCGGTCLGRTRQSCGTQSRYCKWTTKGSQEYSGACQPNFGYHLNKVLKMGMYANDMYVPSPGARQDTPRHNARAHTGRTS